jgi:hypothetical protein
MAGQNGNAPSGEAERYERAATEALEMLDWCIGYLVGCHKDKIGRGSPRIAATIKEHLMKEPEEPVPTSNG